MTPRTAPVMALLGAVLLTLAAVVHLQNAGNTSVPAASTTTTTRSSSSTQAPVSAQTPTGTGARSSGPGSATAQPTPSSSTPTAPSGDKHTDDEHHEAVDVPPRDQRDKAVRSARAFLHDLYATERSTTAWRAALKPRLTSQAADDMSAVEPSWIPPHRLGRGGAVVVQPDDDEHAHRQLETEVRVPLRDGTTVSVFLRPDLKISRYDLTPQPVSSATDER